ncbi:RNase H domain-containing protein [Trichonephila clavipes]|nr:RNase H domain-containing protein [Trichonephila clavipes]
MLQSRKCSGLAHVRVFRPTGHTTQGLDWSPLVGIEGNQVKASLVNEAPVGEPGKLSVRDEVGTGRGHCHTVERLTLGGGGEHFCCFHDLKVIMECFHDSPPVRGVRSSSPNEMEGFPSENDQVTCRRVEAFLARVQVLESRLVVSAYLSSMLLPHILHLPKRCEKSLNLLKVLSNTSWGADRTSLLRVYQAIVLSRIDYGCVAYGSACNSTLQKLDPVHHMALRICSGAFRTSPVQSLYVNCHQLPLDLQRRKLSLAFYFKILSVPSHPLQNVYMSTSMKRLYDARPSNIRPFMDRMKLHISELDLPNVRIQQRNLFLFQPWNTPRFHYINPFATYSKSTVAPVVFQRVFAYHRSQYSRYSAIYTDGSKRADYVGCGVVIEDIMHGYRLDTSCSVFTAEAVAIYRALQLIDSSMPRKYCIYTDSMSVLEALENYNDRCHPVVCKILDITSRLYSKGFDIVFCWLPSHVGIIGNEQADSAAKSATTHLPLAVPLSDMKRVIMHHIFNIWQESWSQQLDNKLHSVKPVIGAWPVMPMRRTDVKLTRLRIGHTRFTHRHLLFGERAPESNFGSCAIKPHIHSLTHPVLHATTQVARVVAVRWRSPDLPPYSPGQLAHCLKGNILILRCQEFEGRADQVEIRVFGSGWEARTSELPVPVEVVVGCIAGEGQYAFDLTPRSDVDLLPVLFSELGGSHREGQCGEEERF